MPDDTDYDDLSERTVDEVKDYVEDNDSVDLERLLRHEKRNKDRTTLKDWLESRIDDEGRTGQHQASSGDAGTGQDGLTLQLSRRQAFIGTFIIGFLAGGFLMAGVFSATGATAMLGADGQQADNPGTNGDAGDTGDGGDSTNRVMLPESIIQNEPTLGSDDAPVKIIEVSDYGCPWCAEWAGYDAIPSRPIDQENTLDKIKSNFVDSGEVQFVYKDYPAHPNAPQAHRAANCIFEQGEDMYWEYHDLIFEQRDRWMANAGDSPNATFEDLAGQVGADVSAFQQCYASADGSESRQDQQEIVQADGRIGTPTIYIGTMEDGFVKVEGAQPYSALETLIQAEVQKAAS